MPKMATKTMYCVEKFLLAPMFQVPDPLST